jgi:hypothetical protein
LTDLYSNSAAQAAVRALPQPPAKKRGWLPLLTVLFIFSYGLMTMLIVEQGQTIEVQRALIRELFRDSTELSVSKMKAQQDRAKAAAQNAAQQKQTPSAQTPSTQTKPVPSAQAPSAQNPAVQVPSSQAQVQKSPSSQAAPQRSRGTNEKSKQQFRAPGKPAIDQATDSRAVVAI